MNLTLDDIEAIFDDLYEPRTEVLPPLILACAFVGITDQATYYGGSCHDCLVGQVSERISPGIAEQIPVVSDWSGVEFGIVGRIFDAVAEDEYINDYDAALRRACDILNVDLELARTLCRAQEHRASGQLWL